MFSLFEIEKESVGKRITLIFLFLITFLVLSSVDVKTKAIQNLSEVDRKLMVLNKPAIKSIKVYFSTNFLLSSYNNKHKQFHTKKKKNKSKHSVILGVHVFNTMNTSKLIHACSYCVKRKINLNLNFRYICKVLESIYLF